MNERPFGHTPGHSRHDRLLVARFTVGESLPGEAEEGRRLLEQCTDCARLAEDLRLLRTSIAGLPTPARTRNFRLTAEQAERLRGNSLERFLRRLAMPGLTMLRPVAGVALAIGLTIMVVGAGLPMAAAPAAAPTQQAPFTQDLGKSPAEGGPSQMPVSAGATDDGRETDVTAVGVSPPSDRTGSMEAADATSAAPLPSTQELAPTAPASDSSADSTRLLLIYGGTTLAMLSFGLLLLAWLARRRLEDPLLR